MSTLNPDEICNMIYKDWANHHLDKTGVRRQIQDLPKDISDGVLLADIVEFVCGKSVERIHKKPRTAKQKLHNIERCLTVLEEHKVPLGDVTVQGLYRAELHSVLALFFHLSRFKQKERAFKMPDVAKPSQKRCLRPPSTVAVGRKSRSFNANDRNRVNIGASPAQCRTTPASPVDEPPKPIGAVQSRAAGISHSTSPANWRSKSMNVKHSTSTKLVASKPSAPTLQPATSNRIGSSSRPHTMNKKPQPAPAMVGESKIKDPLNVGPQRDKSARPSSIAKPSALRTTSKPSSPQQSLERPTSKTVASSTPSPDSDETDVRKTGRKPTSMMSRLRKIGSTTSGAPATVKSRPTSASKVAHDSTSVTSTKKKRAESCPPTSRLSARPISAQQKKQAASKPSEPSLKVKTASSSSKASKSQPALKSVKSSIGKALRPSKSIDQKSPPTGSRKPSKKPHVITKSEICPIIPMVTNADMPVQPIDFLEKPATDDKSGQSRTHNDVRSTALSADRVTTNSVPSLEQHPVKPVGIASPRNPSSRAHKTAMVAPFMRQPTLTNQQSKAVSSSNDSVYLGKPENTITTPAETRHLAVKGIADLRQNLEETMSSLRNTQLRHRPDDALRRRISTQLDGDFTAMTMTVNEESQFPRSNALYRSHHNISSNRVMALNTNANVPKSHAGETLGHHMDDKVFTRRFSSLQRTRSARYSCSSWEDTPLERDIKSLTRNGFADNGSIPGKVEQAAVEGWMKRSGSEEDASDSSGELSDYIDDISTDGFSSTNNSPLHRAKPREEKVATAGDKQLSTGLSKSTMDIESSSKSLKFKKKGITKPPASGLHASGSSVVGSRLACNADNNNNSSPCPSPSQLVVSNARAFHTYKSLPRPNKSKLHEDKGKSSGDSTHQTMSRSHLNFKRSPSLQKLFGLAKTKQSLVLRQSSVDSDPGKGDATTGYSHFGVTTPSVSNPLQSTAYVSANDNRTRTTLAPLNDLTSARTDFSQYNSLGRPARSYRDDPLSYMSLPRRQRTPLSIASSMNTPQQGAIGSVMTWTPPKRPHANSAYSISPTPAYMDLVTTPSLNIDNKDSVNYADPDSVLKNTNPDLFQREVSDWPLPTLLSTPSSPSASTGQVPSSSKPSQDTSYSHFFNSGSSKVTSAAKSPVSSTQPPASLVADGGLKSQLNTHEVSVSNLREGLNGIGSNFRNLAKETQDNDDELQLLKSNIERRIKNNSPDAISAAQSSVVPLNKTSCGSLTSVVSASSVGSTEEGFKKKKKHWLRHSLKTAFGKRKSRTNLSNDLDEMESTTDKSLKEEEESEVVAQLKEELLKKERKLTDIRLEALTSQHQLHQMQDAMHKMKNEIETLRLENERLNQLGLSAISPDSSSNPTREESPLTLSLHDASRSDDRRIVVKVGFPSHMIDDDDTVERSQQLSIGVCYVSRSINWNELDRKVEFVFQNYCRNLSPESSLGLDASSILSYAVGEANRSVNGEAPELLPCAYIIGTVDSLVVKLRDGALRSTDALSLELLVDRDIIQRYVNLVLDHGRVMLSGPSGTGKSTLANRLAEHIARLNPKLPCRTAIVRLDLKHRSENEIVDYLHQLSEDCSKPESSGKDIPVVLVLDDLHRSRKLTEAILPLLASASHSQLPYLIGVAEHCTEPGLELHQEFRWILCSNHTPPVVDYLDRILKMSLCSCEVNNCEQVDKILTALVDWLPQCWKHINKCIESFNSADVTLGPRMFASCPMDAAQSIAWFTDLWNFSLVPYVISAVKQGTKYRQNKLEWTDPLDWVKESWPWPSSCDLLPIRAEDVALEPFSPGADAPVNDDPLLTMMLKLQEAASVDCESDASHEETFERCLDRALGDLS